VKNTFAQIDADRANFHGMILLKVLYKPLEPAARAAADHPISSKAWPATEAGAVGPANVSDRAAASGQAGKGRVVDLAVQAESTAL